MLALLVLIAISDVRLGTRAGGGIEGGTMLKEAKPEAIAEAGVNVDFMPAGWRFGFGIVYEKVKRTSSTEPIATETKVDVMLRLADKQRRIVGGFGAGIRRLDVEGDNDVVQTETGTRRTDRPASEIWGIDLMRMEAEIQFVRLTGKVGELALGLYFSWTFGRYDGEVFETRVGDMPYRKRDFESLSSTYVLGVQSSIYWR